MLAVVVADVAGEGEYEFERRKFGASPDQLRLPAEGETDPAALADHRPHATPEQLRDALGACTELHGVCRGLMKMAVEEWGLIEERIGHLDKEICDLLNQHQNTVRRLAEVSHDFLQQIATSAVGKAL